MKTSQTPEWVAWLKADDAHGIQAWVNTLNFGSEEEVSKLPQHYHLSEDDKGRVRAHLLEAEKFNAQALERMHRVAPMSSGWLYEWIRKNENAALLGGRLENVIDWWLSAPLEGTDASSRHDEVVRARDSQINELAKNGGKAERGWEVLGRLSAYEDKCDHSQGVGGLWAMLTLELTNEGAKINGTQHWTEQMLCDGLRLAMMAPFSRGEIWGANHSIPALKWDRWEQWLNESPNRKAAWDRLIVEDRASNAAARGWTRQAFPSGTWEGSLLNGGLGIGKVFEHPYWGECAGLIGVLDDEDIDILDTSLVEARRVGECSIPMAHQLLSRWLYSLANDRVRRGDDELLKAFEAAPCSKWLPCPPNLMSLCAISNSVWIRTTAMKSSAGTAALLDALSDERVAAGFNLTPETLMDWLAGPQSDQVRAWRNPQGNNLLSMCLPQGWKTNSTPPLTPSLAKGFMEKAPEWLIQPLPQGGSLLDFQLTEPKAQAYIQGKLMEQHTATPMNQGARPSRRM